MSIDFFSVESRVTPPSTPVPKAPSRCPVCDGEMPHARFESCGLLCAVVLSQRGRIRSEPEHRKPHFLADLNWGPPAPFETKEATE